MHQSKRTLLHASLLIVFVATALFAAENASETPISKTLAEQNPDIFAPKPPPVMNSPVLSNLVFDASTKQYDAKYTETNAPFSFFITNVWTNEITIDRVKSSCGCTVAKLPSSPWRIPPGEHGEVVANINIGGKFPGLLTKTLTFHVSVNGIYSGTRVATLKVNIPAPPPPAALSAADRKAAMEKAKADPQQIFKDAKCAECHVEIGRHLEGAELYAADCGICHDSPNRESTVPDLHALKHPTDLAYWKQIIIFGKPNSLMPAFSEAHGGPLSLQKIDPLAAYLDSPAFAQKTAAGPGTTNAAIIPSTHTTQ